MINDFTREELQEIFDLILRAYGESSKYLTIMKKIQSMLDKLNCVHESDGFVYTNPDFSNGYPYRCIKCREYYG